MNKAFMILHDLLLDVIAVLRHQLLLRTCRARYLRSFRPDNIVCVLLIWSFPDLYI